MFCAYNHIKHETLFQNITNEFVKVLQVCIEPQKYIFTLHLDT